MNKLTSKVNKTELKMGQHLNRSSFSVLLCLRLLVITGPGLILSLLIFSGGYLAGVLVGRGVQALDPDQSISRHLFVLQLQLLVVGESSLVMLTLEQIDQQRILRGLELVSRLKYLREDLLV